MPTFSINVLVGHPAGGELVGIYALVDSAATDSVFPKSLMAELGIMATDQVAVQGVGGMSVIDRGRARLSIFGEERICPVLFGSDNLALVGASFLDSFSLLVDGPVGTMLVACAKMVRLYAGAVMSTVRQLHRVGKVSCGSVPALTTIVVLELMAGLYVGEGIKMVGQVRPEGIASCQSAPAGSILVVCVRTVGLYVGGLTAEVSQTLQQAYL